MKKSSTQLTPQDIDTHKLADIVYGFKLLLYNHNSDFWLAFMDSSHCPEHMNRQLNALLKAYNTRTVKPHIMIEWLADMDTRNLRAFSDGLVAYFYGMNPQLLAHLPIKDCSEVK